MAVRPVPGPVFAAASIRRRFLVHLLVVLLFGAGVVAGTSAAAGIDPGQRQELDRYVQQLAGEDRQPPPLGPLLRHTLWEHGVRTAGLMWVLGLSIIGAPFILAVVFLRGFGLGFATGFLIKQKAVEGTLLTLVGVLPHHLLAVPGLLLAGSAALSFSAVAAAIILGRRQLSAFPQFVASTVLCLLGAGLLMAGALVEAYITPVLLRAIGGYFPW